MQFLEKKQTTRKNKTGRTRPGRQKENKTIIAPFPGKCETSIHTKQIHLHIELIIYIYRKRINV